MKFKKGQKVYSTSYYYWYEITNVFENTYEVNNLSNSRKAFVIAHPEMVKRFEEDCISEELYNSPLYKALE